MPRGDHQGRYSWNEAARSLLRLEAEAENQGLGRRRPALEPGPTTDLAPPDEALVAPEPETRRAAGRAAEVAFRGVVADSASPAAPIEAT